MTQKAPSRPGTANGGRPPKGADLRAEIDNAPEAPRKDTNDGQQREHGKTGGGVESDAGRQSGSGGRKGRDRERGEIFRDCPVKALGIDGDLHFFLDTRGQIRALNGSFQKNHMLSVFGGQIGLLQQKFPSYTKSGDVQPNDFKALNLATAMITAATERGVWSPVGNVRGAGAWADDDGELIYHAGDEVLIGGKWQRPGVYDGKVYPATRPVPRPTGAAGIADAALQVLELFETWHWRRPDIDPVLALGAVCGQMVGGALEWRPVTWLTGDAATGKSTFQRALRHVHGGADGLLQASDATEAGIRSVIGYSSMPVAIDELEPDDDPKKGKAAAIVRLARIAASGDQVLRGSTDQKGYQGNAYSAFLFSSILVPPLPPQDRSRLILLDLERLSADAPKVDIDARRLKTLGAAIRRRLIDGWESWHERLEIWRAGLSVRGHSGRTADNYGTVLALADMALHGVLPSSDAVASWCAKLDAHLVEDASDSASNSEDMLVYLLSQPLDPFRRGKRHTVATWLAVAARLDGAPDEIEGLDWQQANRELASYGLRVYGRGMEAELAIASKTLANLCALFEGSPWAEGVWSQAARRVPGARAAGSMTLARVATRGWRLPFTSAPGLLNAVDDAKPAPAEPPIPADFRDFE